LPNMVRWVIWEKVVVVRHLALSVLAVALVALLAGCGGEEKTKELTAPTQETEILEETTATQAPPRDEEATKAARQSVGDTSTTVSIDPNSSVPPDEQIEFFRLGCQTFKAQQAEGQEAVDAYFQEAISAGTTMAEVLSGRGYECTDQEVRVMQRQD
jgi:hypothetical protein